MSNDHWASGVSEEGACVIRHKRPSTSSARVRERRLPSSAVAGEQDALPSVLNACRVQSNQVSNFEKRIDHHIQQTLSEEFLISRCSLGRPSERETRPEIQASKILPVNNDGQEMTL
jgi:hypothetical protein